VHDLAAEPPPVANVLEGRLWEVVADTLPVARRAKVRREGVARLPVASVVPEEVVEAPRVDGEGLQQRVLARRPLLRRVAEFHGRVDEGVHLVHQVLLRPPSEAVGGDVLRERHPLVVLRDVVRVVPVL
jgi:hypothetical protein